MPPRVSLLNGNGTTAGSSPFSGVATDDELLNEFAGLGLCDVGTGHPETDSSAIPSERFAAWTPVYYGRLVEHVRRAARRVGCGCRLPEGGEGEEVGGGEGGGGGGGGNSPSSSSSSPSSNPSSPSREFHPSTCCAPRVIAFTGKRQFVELLNAGRGDPARSKDTNDGNNNKRKKAPFDSSSVAYGLQPRSLRPKGWPRCLSETEIWVLTTTSGAAGLTNEARAAPYLELGRRLASEEWPRPLPACCADKEGK